MPKEDHNENAIELILKAIRAICAGNYKVAVLRLEEALDELQ